MEEFDDDDDFSDLYADVEVQASSAISSMHGLTGMPPADGGIFSNDNDDFPQLAGEKGGVFERGIRGKEEENVFSKTEIAVGHGGSYGNATGVEEAGKDVEGGRNIVSNDSSDGKKQRKQKFADNHDNGSNCSYKNGIEVGVKNARKHGGEEIEEEEKKEGGGIHGNEKNLNAGGCHSRRKDQGSYTVAVSSNWKGNGSVPADWEDNECGRVMDGSPVVEWGQSFPLPHSRASRHTPACYCTPSDLDKYGSVRISDSEEDNHHRHSDSDSDGMAEATETHDGTDIRKSSSKSNKVLSVVEPDLSCSPSPHQAVRDDDTGRSHKHSEKTSVRLDSQLWKFTACDYHTSKDSESHHVNPNTRDGRYYERDRCPKGRSHKHSKRLLTSEDSKMPESFLCGYRPLKISKSHGVKANTRDDRYYGRDRDPIRKDLKLQGRSDHVSTLKTHLNDRGAYDGIDIRDYDVHRFKKRHRKQAILNSNKKDMPYCNGAEGYSTYFRGSSPNYHSAYLKGQYWKVHPSFGCEAGGSDNYNMNEKQNLVKRRRTNLDYEDLEDDWHHSERRQNMNHLKFEGSRKLIPKYPSYAVNQRGTKFSEKGDSMQFSGKRGDLPPHFEYDDAFVEGNNSRYMLNRDRKGDHLCHRYNQKVLHDRRDMESPRRDKMKYDSPFNTFDNSLYMNNEDNDRKYIKDQPLLFRSYKEPHVPSKAQFHRAAASKSLVHERPVRNMRCSWEERYGENDRYGNYDAMFDTSEGIEYSPTNDHLAQRKQYPQSSFTFNTNRSIRNHHDVDRFLRRRHHLEPETLHLNEEDYKSKWHDEIMFHTEGSSHHFERVLGDKRPDRRYATNRVTEFINERELDGGRYRLIGDGNCSNHLDPRSKFVHPDSRVQMHQRHRVSTDSCLVVEGKKCTTLSSGRTSDAGDAIRHGRYNLMEWNNDRAPESFKELNSFNPVKAVSSDGRKAYTNQSDKNWHNKFSSNQQNEFLDIEEGQIIGEEVNGTPLDCETASKDVTQDNDMAQHETAPNPNSNTIADGLDDQRIQEIIMKMERRRERFKDPISLNKDSEKASKCLPDSDTETAVAKVVRPARKRKWLGS